MENNFSLLKICKNGYASLRKNFDVFSNMAFLLFAGNYVFLNLENISRGFLLLHLMAMYAFYYAFLRIYFGKKPIFTTESFLKSLGKIAIIFLLEFAFIVLLKTGFLLLYYLAKSMAVFPDIYSFLRGVYAFFAGWGYTKAVMVMLIFAISCFVFFIPSFAWVGTLLDEEASILFSLIETRKHYALILACYMILFGVCPMFVGALMLSQMLPVMVTLCLSTIMTMTQLIIYAEMYKSLFSFSRFVKE